MSDYLRDILGNGRLPVKSLPLTKGLVAAGDEGANKGFWRVQLRDKSGNWVKMGGAVTFEVDLPDLGKVFGTGTYQGRSEKNPNEIIIRVNDHPKLADGDYSIPSENLEESAEAILPAEALDGIPTATVSKSIPEMEKEAKAAEAAVRSELRDEIDGDEAMQVVRNAGAEYAKSQGRFPMARTYDDIKQGLRSQYVQLLEGIKQDNPELLKNKFIVNEDGTARTADIVTEDDFWGVIKALQVGTGTRYIPPSNIDPLAKEINRRYAEKFLGLKKDGLITFYRNVIRGLESGADSAAGYASLDRKMAWDYNSDKRLSSSEHTGRYIVKAKPDEVQGILGLSGAVDEFGVVISPEITNLPGRFERVGDLEKQTIDTAPWVSMDLLDQTPRSLGGGPFRFLAPMANFDYYPLDSNPFGEENTWASFYRTNGLDQGAIPNKYNELYGAGSWERDWKDENPSPKTHARLFMEFTGKDGKKQWGLNGLDLKNLTSFDLDIINKANPGDAFDRQIKVLSVLQELLGKPFFVNKGHPQDDPRVVEAVQAAEETPDGDVEWFDDEEQPTQSSSDIPYSAEAARARYLDPKNGGVFKLGDTIPITDYDGNVTQHVVNEEDISYNTKIVSEPGSLVYSNPLVQYSRIPEGTPAHNFMSEWYERNKGRFLYYNYRPLERLIDKDAEDKFGNLADDGNTQYDYKIGMEQSVYRHIRFNRIGLHIEMFKEMAEALPEYEWPKQLETFVEYQKNIKALSEALPEARISISIDGKDFLKVISDGRFKSQFETNTSGGIYNIGSRTRTELGSMGAPADLDPAKRPIYGNLVISDLGRFDAIDMEQDTFKVTSPNTMGYGNVKVILKPEVKRKATYTAEDSLTFGADSARPLTESFTPESLILSGISRYDSALPQTSDIKSDYFEVQIHNGVSLNDIDKIIVSTSSLGVYDKDSGQQTFAEVSKALKDAGLDIPIQLTGEEREIDLSSDSSGEQSGDSDPFGDVEWLDDSEEKPAKPEGPGLTVDGRSELRSIKRRLGSEIFDPYALKLIDQYSGSDDDLKKLDAALFKEGLYRKGRLFRDDYTNAVRSAISDYKKIDPNLNTERKAKKAPFGALDGTGLGVIGYLQEHNFTKFDNFDLSYASDKNKLSAAREEIIKNGFTDPITILYDPNTWKFSLENPEDSLKILATREIKDPNIKIRAIPTVVRIPAESNVFYKDTELNPIFFDDLNQPSAWVADIEVKPEEYYDLSGVEDLPVPDRTDFEKEAINFYQRGTYLTLKKYLKDPSSAGDDAEKVGKIVDALNKMGNSEKLPANTKLFRGFRFSADSDLYRYYSSLEPGDVIADPDRFASTSLDLITAEDFSTLGGRKGGEDFTGSIMLEISTEEGATGVVFGNTGDSYDSEKEVLLPFAAELKINKIFKDSDGILRIQASYGKKQGLEPKSDGTDKDFIDFSNFKKVSGRLGHTSGGKYQDPKTGKEYYVKIQDERRGDNEALASALYNEAGVDSIRVKRGVLDGTPITYTEWRDDLSPISERISKITSDDPALDGFAIDAWLANWDTVGAGDFGGYDNISYDKDNNPVRIDAGGALLYRGAGMRKGGAFGSEVGELETFKDTNFTTGQLFSKVSYDTELASADKLRKITPERIDELVDEYITDSDDNKELKEKLKARREYILSKYAEKSSEVSKDEEKEDPFEVKPGVLETDVTTGDVSAIQNAYLLMWTGNDWYKAVNTYLRFPKEITEKDRKEVPGLESVVEQLTQATKNNKFKKDQVLLRRIGLRSENLKVGDIIDDTGFQATTKSSKIGTNVGMLYEAFGDNFTDYKIYAKKGQPGLDLEKASFGAAKSEREVLLPPGTKFKVLSVAEVPHRIEGMKGHTLVEVEIVDAVEKEIESEKTGTSDKSGDVTWFDDEEFKGYKLIDAAIESGNINYKVLPESTIKSNFTKQSIPEEQDTALVAYSNSLYIDINEYLRKNYKNVVSSRDYLESNIANLDALIDEKGDVSEQTVVYRGTSSAKDDPTGLLLDSLKEGDIVDDLGYSSTTKNPKIAFEAFGPANQKWEGVKTSTDTPSVRGGNSSFWAITLPAGSKALARPSEEYAHGHEKEVLLPRGSKFKINRIRKVEQVKNGKKNGNFNYFIDATVVPDEPNKLPNLVDVNAITDQEGLALEYFSRGDYDTSLIVNKFLRNGKKISDKFGNEIFDKELINDPASGYIYRTEVVKSEEELNSIVDNINNSIYKYGLIDEPTTLYRGVSSYSLYEDRFDKLKVGDLIPDVGFSTSTDRSIAEKFMGAYYGERGISAGLLLKINIPKGSYGLRLSDEILRVFYGGKKDKNRTLPFTNNMEEKEVLLPSGSQFKVKSITRVPRKGRRDKDYEIELDLISQEPEIVVLPEKKESEKTGTNDPFGDVEWFEEEQPVSTSTVLDNLVKDGIVNLDAAPDSTILSNFTKDSIPSEQADALSYYSSTGYRSTNNLLRFGPESDSPKTEGQLAIIRQKIKHLDDLIESKGNVETEGFVYRGMIELPKFEDTDITMSEMLDGLKPGDVVSDPAFLSTSSDKNVALRKFGPGKMTEDGPTLDASNPVYEPSSFWAIRVPAGAKALPVPKEDFGYASSEKEVLLPRDTQLRIDGIKKVAQEEEGGENGNFNYFIEATVVPVSSEADPLDPPRVDVPEKYRYKVESNFGVDDYYNKLVDKIHSELGYYVAGLPFSKEYNMLEGKTFTNRDTEIKKVKGLVGKNNCWQNVAEAIRQGWDGDVYLGFSADEGSDRGSGHAWLSKNGEILETTHIAREVYFGKKLSDEEKKQFLSEWPEEQYKESEKSGSYSKDGKVTWIDDEASEKRKQYEQFLDNKEQEERSKYAFTKLMNYVRLPVTEVTEQMEQVFQGDWKYENGSYAEAKSGSYGKYANILVKIGEYEPEYGNQDKYSSYIMGGHKDLEKWLSENEVDLKEVVIKEGRFSTGEIKPSMEFGSPEAFNFGLRPLLNGSDYYYIDTQGGHIYLYTNEELKKVVLEEFKKGDVGWTGGKATKGAITIKAPKPKYAWKIVFKKGKQLWEFDGSEEDKNSAFEYLKKKRKEQESISEKSGVSSKDGEVEFFDDEEQPAPVKIKDLSADEGYSLEFYSRGLDETSRKINTFLQMDRVFDWDALEYDFLDEDSGEDVVKTESELNNIADNINNAIYKHGKLDNPTTLYRGVGENIEGMLENLSVGDTISEPGFSSTALDPKIARQFANDPGRNGVLFKINAPKGSYGLRLGDDLVSAFSNKYGTNGMKGSEVLLPSGTKFKIVSIEKELFEAPRTGKYLYSIEVDVVPQEKKIVKSVGPIMTAKIKARKTSRLATKEEVDKMLKKAEDLNVTESTDYVIEQLLNDRENITIAAVKDVLKMIKEDIAANELFDEGEKSGGDSSDGEVKFFDDSELDPKAEGEKYRSDRSILNKFKSDQEFAESYEEILEIDRKRVEWLQTNGVTVKNDDGRYPLLTTFTPEEVQNAYNYIPKGGIFAAEEMSEEQGKEFNRRMRALANVKRPGSTSDETIEGQNKLNGEGASPIEVKELRHSAPAFRFDDIMANGIKPKATNKVGGDNYTRRRFGVFLANDYTSSEAGERADVFRVKVPENDLRVDSGYTPFGENLYIERTVKPEELEHIGHYPVGRGDLHSGRGAECKDCDLAEKKRQEAEQKMEKEQEEKYSTPVLIYQMKFSDGGGLAPQHVVHYKSGADEFHRDHSIEDCPETAKNPGVVVRPKGIEDDETVDEIVEAAKPASESKGTEDAKGEVTWFDDEEAVASVAPKSDSNMTSRDGRRTIKPKEIVAFETYENKELVKLTYTGTRLSDIFSDEGIPFPDDMHLFELKDSPDPGIPNGVYIIYSDDLDEDAINESGLPTFDPDRNHFISAKMPIKRSASEQKAIDRYTSSGYREINTDLIENDGNPSDVNKQDVKDLDSHIDNSALDEDTVLWRGLSISDLAYKNYLESLIPGDIVSQASYISTSRSRASASSFLETRVGSSSDLAVLMKINAKKGTKGGNVFRSNLGATSHEEEVLLPRGDKMTDSLVVTKVEKDKYVPNLLHIEFDYKPTPPAKKELAAEKKKGVKPGFKNWNKEVEKIFEDWDNDLIDGVEGTYEYDGNILQANFIKKAGFNGKPKVLSQEEFDAIEAEPIYRGHQSTSFVKSYTDGETQYAGEGYFGNGTYTSNKKDTAETYAAGKGGPEALTKAEIEERTLEMKMLPDANVLSFDEVPELREWADQKTREFLEGYEKSGANPAQMQEAEWRLFNEADYTNIAIMLGIDAIRFKVPLTDKEEYYTIILNRGKVAINGKS
jgi:hypothetical protein